MEIQLVIFKLGSESYGVEIATVEGIIKMQAITRLPQAPPFIEGVTNLRGRIIPVIDLRKRLGIPLTTLEDHPVIDLTFDGADEVDPAPLVGPGIVGRCRIPGWHMDPIGD